MWKDTAFTVFERNQRRALFSEWLTILEVIRTKCLRRSVSDNDLRVTGT